MVWQYAAQWQSGSGYRSEKGWLVYLVLPARPADQYVDSPDYSRDIVYRSAGKELADGIHHLLLDSC